MAITSAGLGANKGYWKVQLRDRFGKFVEMGGGVTFDIQLPGVVGLSRGRGYFIGNDTPEIANIEVRDDDAGIPKGIYKIPHKDLTAVKAFIGIDVPNKEEPAAEKREPRKQVTGKEVLKSRLAAVAAALKEKGRFPVPREATLNTWGKTSDTTLGAKKQYKAVFDAEPALQEKYKSFENMWEAVYKFGADERTQSPNDLAEIPEDMKELNRAYAKHVLGMDPDGIITTYRNAVNGKDSEAESAVGYVSINPDLAYDYAADPAKNGMGANGRYEVDVKPDEIYGMLGYSKIEDEYAFTVGRGVTSQEGRVRRVGDIAPVDLDAEWMKEYGRTEFPRGRGATPYRHFTMSAQFDYHEVEPLGDTLQDFLGKYGLSAEDIKKMFDQLYGEGAYDKYKASGNTVSWQLIKSLFVDLGNGKVGLDGAKLDRMGGIASSTDEYTGDRLDNTLKMLQVLQMLSNQIFFTHSSRNYTP